MKVFKVSTYDQAKKTASEIISQAPKNIDDKIKVFCEDKFTMAIERSIAKKCGGGFNHEVSSFNLFMRDNLPETSVLSTRSSAVVVRSVLLKKINELALYNKSVSPDLALEIYELIAQLKSAKITPDDLLRAKDECKGTLQAKLSDLYLVFCEYEKYLKDKNLLDGNNYLSLMPEIIRNSREIKDTTVILCGYPSVTRQSAEIFKAFFDTAKQVIFIVVCGDNGDVYLNETLNFIQNSGQKVEYVDNTVGLNDEAKIIRDNLFRVEKPSPKFNTQNVKVYSATDVNDEIRRVAKSLSTLIHSGLRYRNINVAVGNMQNYKLPIKRIFKEYGIPYYIDEQKSLADHPVIKFVKKAIDVRIKNYDVSSVYELVGDGVFMPDKRKSDAFILYCSKFAVNRKAFLTPFEDVDDGLENAEDLRRKLISVVDCFSGKTTVLQHTQAVKRAIILSDAQKNVDLTSEKLNLIGEYEKASFNEQAIEKLDALLDEIAGVMDTDVLTLKEFGDVLISGAKACKVSLIPQFADSVYVGDFTASRYVSTDYTFVVGMDENVPYQKNDTALLTDKDLFRLDDLSVIIEPKIKVVNRRQREAVCLSLISFGKFLHLSYSTTTVKGKEGFKSPIISDIERLFTNGESGFTEYSEKMLATEVMYSWVSEDRINDYVAEKFVSPKVAEKQFVKEANGYRLRKYGEATGASAYYYAVQKAEDNLTKRYLDDLSLTVGEPISEKPLLQKGTELYFNDGEVSVTTLEDFFSCPYKCFLSHGLKLKEDEDGKVKANEYGTLIHAVLEKFVKKLKKDGLTQDVCVENVVDDIFKQQISSVDVGKYKKKKEYEVAFEMLKGELVRICGEILSGYSTSEFKPFGVEVDFGYENAQTHQKSKFDAITLNGNGCDYKVRGKVDRADVYGNYIRIVDYKSGKLVEGNVKFYNEKLLYAGKKLQLYLYMNAFIQNGEYKPAGVYYSQISNDVDEKGIEEINSKLQGKTLKDKAVISASDVNFGGDNTKSRFINLEKKKGDEMPSKDCLDEVTMKAYLTYAKKVSENAVKDISDGYVAVTPFENACENCKYKGICGYNPYEKCRTRSISAVGEDVITQAVKGDKQ